MEEVFCALTQPLSPGEKVEEQETGSGACKGEMAEGCE